MTAPGLQHSRMSATALLSAAESSAGPPHKGLLLDEVLVIRQVFGYGDSYDTIPVQFSLEKTGIKRIRILSVDIDALQQENDVIRQFHIGISIFDTESLEACTSNPADTRQTPSFIESHNYAVENASFSRRISNKFLFGEFETISLTDLKARLEAITSNRDVILGFHGGNRELWAFRKLNNDIHPLFIIDTVKAAQHPVQLSYRYSLEKLLDELLIPFADLHMAGNDAHFILRAFLMIAVKDIQRQASIIPSFITILESVAQALVPPTRGEILAAREKKRQAREANRLLRRSEED